MSANPFDKWVRDKTESYRAESDRLARKLRAVKNEQEYEDALYNAACHSVFGYLSFGLLPRQDWLGIAAQIAAKRSDHTFFIELGRAFETRALRREKIKPAKIDAALIGGWNHVIVPGFPKLSDCSDNVLAMLFNNSLDAIRKRRQRLGLKRPAKPSIRDQNQFDASIRDQKPLLL